MLSANMEPLRELIQYVRTHTVSGTLEEPGPKVIDVHFFRVRIKDSFNTEYFRYLFDLFAKTGEGEFGKVEVERIKGGPSYIEWGGWLGDQGLAMTAMAAGAYAGLWDVITPETIGITGAAADQLAGMGLVMTSGLK